MSKFRKKPIVIEAFQMTFKARHSNINWPNWLHEAWNKEPGEGAMFIDADDPQRLQLCLGTLEGVQRITWDDWIVRGVKGELFSVKPDVWVPSHLLWKS